MPFNGSGNFNIVNTFVAGTTILSSAVNQNYSDIATGLSNAMTKDGQQVATANQNMGNFKFTNVGNGSSSGDSANYGQLLAAILTATPVGSVIEYAGTSAPAMWLFCDGSAVSRTTYASLFAVISTTYGAGDGSTTFNVPDYRGRVGAGKDNMGGTAASRIGTISTDSGTITGSTLGSTGGSATHTQAAGEVGQHNHTATSNVTDPGHTHTYWNASLSGGNIGGAGGSQNNGTTGSATTGITVGTTVNNSAAPSSMAWLQPTLIVNKIIFANA